MLTLIKATAMLLFVGVIYSLAGHLFFIADILEDIQDVIGYSLTAGITMGIYLERKIG